MILTKLSSLIDGPSWKLQHANRLVWRRRPATIRNGKKISVLGEGINHGLEDILDLGYDDAWMVILRVIVGDLYDS